MIKVAILDTGIDTNHKQLSKYINFDFSKSFIDKSLKDYHGHGTAIAGVTIYDGLFNGEVKDIQLIIVKMTNEMVFNIDIFIKAFEYVIELGINIINLSFNQFISEC